MTLTDARVELRAGPRPGRYELDPDRTIIEVEARHFVVLAVRARLHARAGELTVARRPEDSWVRVDVDAESVATGNRDRDAAIRHADVLATEEFPVIRLETASAMTVAGVPSTYEVLGDLYLRDAVTEVRAHAVVVDHDDDRVRLAARMRVSRSSLGLRWASEIERFGILVSDTLRVTVAAEFRR